MYLLFKENKYGNIIPKKITWNILKWICEIIISVVLIKYIPLLFLYYLSVVTSWRLMYWYHEKRWFTDSIGKVYFLGLIPIINLLFIIAIPIFWIYEIIKEYIEDNY